LGGLIRGIACTKGSQELLILIAILLILTNKRFGLKEIKAEIREIEEKLDMIVSPLGNFTTGPVIKDVTASSLIVKVLNNSNVTQSVLVIVFDLTDCEKTEFDSIELEVEPGCAEEHIFGEPPINYEVQFLGLVANVFGWTATRTQAAPAPITASNLVAANTFRHSELSPTI
jgi:hypothetical protein